VSAPATYDPMETKDLDYFATIGFMNETKAQQQNLQAERKARLYFARFVDRGVGEEVLDGPAAEWKERFDKFVAELKKQLLKLAS
jgi:hypothetical protein